MKTSETLTTIVKVFFQFLLPLTLVIFLSFFIHPILGWGVILIISTFVLIGVYGDLKHEVGYWLLIFAEIIFIVWMFN